MSSSIIIATRGSLLARWQAEHVAQLLLELGHQPSLHLVKTTGDRVQDRYLHEIGGKGLFIKELEESLLAGRAHIAVHSMKDLPAKMVEPFEITATLPRHDSRDVLIVPAGQTFLSQKSEVSKESAKDLRGKRIATSSLRRQCYLRSAVPAIDLQPLRGNVDTRLRKLLDGEYDGIVLAKAAMERLQMHVRPDILIVPFDPKWFVPCVAQGIISIESVTGSKEGNAAAQLNHPTTFLQAFVERHILATLGGDCTLPFGCHTQVTSGKASDSITIDTVVIAPSGREARSHQGFDLPTLVKAMPLPAMRQATQFLISAVMKNLKEAGANAVLAELKLEPIHL